VGPSATIGAFRRRIRLFALTCAVLGLVAGPGQARDRSFSLRDLMQHVARDTGGGDSDSGGSITPPATCPADFQAAKARLQQADNAAAARRWSEALTGYDEADAKLNDVTAKCGVDEASDATALSDAIPAKKDAARQAAGPAPAQAQSQNPGQCQPATSKAFAFDNEAAGHIEEKAWREADQAFAKAEAAWGEAAELCDGAGQQSARRNQADSARFRAILAPRLEDPRACDKAHADAQRMMNLAETARAGGEADDVALWRRKASMAWGVAVEKCRGERQVEARRQQDATADAADLTRSVPVAAAAAPDAKPATAAPEAPAAPISASAGTPAPAPVSTPVSTPTVAAAETLTVKVGDTTFSGRFSRDAKGGTLSGEGKVIWDRGDVYTGPLVQGRAQGRGSMVWASGARYDGDWQDEQPQGRGVFTHVNGDRYEGEFLRGVPSGHGRILYQATGDEYDGEVKSGIPHGQGTYRWKNGDHFDGQWQDGKKHGHGRHTWANGNAWEGEYANGERTEQGREILAAKP
jgi:hypothetical protein